MKNPSGTEEIKEPTKAIKSKLGTYRNRGDRGLSRFRYFKRSKTRKQTDEITKGPISWMAKNSVAANILMVVLLLGGLVSIKQVKQEFLPAADLDMVQINVPYPGASPEEVELGILLAVEEAVRGIDGVKKVTSRASEGNGTVTIEVLTSHNVSDVTDDVRNQIDRIRTFPLDAEEPIISALKLKRAVMDLVIAADVSDTVLRELAEQTRASLLANPGISQLELELVREYEIAIEINQNKLREYGLTLQQVSQIISQSAVEIPSGGMKTTGGEILVRVKDRRDVGRDFAAIPIITTPEGTKVLLQDMADIRDGFDESDKFSFYNGKPAIGMTVYRTGKETPLSVEKAVKEVLSDLEASMPDGIDFIILNNRADSFRGRMKLLLKNGALGLVLVFILLGLFLEMRLAFWVMLGIPISFLGTFLLMPVWDVSLNMITMFAFIISLGIVVDDAIVVGENIYHYHQNGLSFIKSAAKGAREIAMPVIFSVITNIVAFLPLYFVPGVMGKFFRNIPMIVCTTFAISLIESLFILPAHLGHQKQRTKLSRIQKLQRAFSDKFIHFVRTIYGPFLNRVLNYRYITLFIGIFVLIITIAYIRSGRMGFELFPSTESDTVMCNYSLPFGAPVENTLKVQDRIIAGAKKSIESVNEEFGVNMVKGIYKTIGNGGGHAGRVRCELVDPDIRPISADDFAARWRKATGPVSGIKNMRFSARSGGPGGGPAVTVELSHQSMQTLEAASKELAGMLEEYQPMVQDIDDGFTPGKPQIDFKINDQGRSLGLTANDIARQLRNAYYGAEAIRQQRGRNEVKVKVRLTEAERDTEQSLDELIIRTPSGIEVPLHEVVELKRGRAYTAINRRDGRRNVTVSANVEPRDKSSQILDVLKSDMLPKLLTKYSGLSYSFEGQQADRRESVGALMTGLYIALLCIYALLAIPFKSYLQPLIIMVSIPFGLVGALVGHLILGYSLSLMSLFGVVALSGVVINDSLVFIDFANKRRRDGLNLHDAVVDAGIQRFRPIILTTLTTFLGLTPMILETSRQARFLIPMAISLGFGILFATGITLILIPSLTLILEDIGNLFKVREK